MTMRRKRPAKEASFSPLFEPKSDLTFCSPWFDKSFRTKNILGGNVIKYS